MCVFPNFHLIIYFLNSILKQPAAFHQLKAALERHKSDPNSSSHGASKLLDQLSLARGPRNPQVIIDSASTSADVTGSSSPQDPFEEQQPVDDLDTYIPPGERDGLPAPLDHAPLYEKKARRLILGHKFGFGFGSSSESKAKRGRTKTKKVDKQTNHPFDVEKRGGSSVGMGTSNKTFGTGGVLSSLLALYGQQEQRQSNSNESTPTSTIFDPDEGGENSHRRKSQSSSVPGTPGESSPNKPFHPSHRRASSYDNLMKQFKPSTRPVAARSAGGVFGGLIASTNNLTGVATPTASSLAPIPDRSGFHISRCVQKSRVRLPWSDFAISGIIYLKKRRKIRNRIDPVDERVMSGLLLRLPPMVRLGTLLERPLREIGRPLLLVENLPSHLRAHRAVHKPRL